MNITIIINKNWTHGISTLEEIIFLSFVTQLELFDVFKGNI